MKDAEWLKVKAVTRHNDDTKGVRAMPKATPPPKAAPPTAPPGEEAAHPLEVDASSAAPHEPTAPELDDSAEQLEAELEKVLNERAALNKRVADLEASIAERERTCQIENERTKSEAAELVRRETEITMRRVDDLRERFEDE